MGRSHIGLQHGHGRVVQMTRGNEHRMERRGVRVKRHLRGGTAQVRTSIKTRSTPTPT